MLLKLIAIAFLIEAKDVFRKSTATLFKQLSAEHMERLCFQNVLPQSLQGTQ